MPWSSYYASLLPDQLASALQLPLAARFTTAGDFASDDSSLEPGIDEAEHSAGGKSEKTSTANMSEQDLRNLLKKKEKQMAEVSWLLYAYEHLTMENSLYFVGFTDVVDQP